MNGGPGGGTCYWISLLQNPALRYEKVQLRCLISLQANTKVLTTKTTCAFPLLALPDTVQHPADSYITGYVRVLRVYILPGAWHIAPDASSSA